VAGRFPLFTDNHVQQAVVEGLLQRGWNVVRAIDVFPEKTRDEVLLEYAASQGRVFVTNDEPIEKTAVLWLSQGRSFPGLVFWEQQDYQAMTTGGILEAFEAFAEKDNAFGLQREPKRGSASNAREEGKSGRIDPPCFRSSLGVSRAAGAGRSSWGGAGILPKPAEVLPRKKLSWQGNPIYRPCR